MQQDRWYTNTPTNVNSSWHDW